MANRFDHILDAYEKEYNVKIAVRKVEFRDASILSMEDKATPRIVWNYSIENRILHGGGRDADKHIIEIVQELGRELRTTRKKQGRDEKTGHVPIAYAPPVLKGFSIFVDEYTHIPTDDTKPIPVTKPKVKPNYSKLKNFGIY